MRLRRLAPAALLLATMFATASHADMDEALTLVDEGHAAHKAGKYDVAIDRYRRALTSAEGCLPARLGLGEALLAKGETQDAILAFRRVLRESRATAIPTAWKTLAPQARARLDANDEHGTELEDLIDAHVAKVMRVAVAYRTKDPDLAQRALHVVLTLRPEHKRGLALLEKMSAQGARKESIFDGKQIGDWDGASSRWWTVRDGIIVGDTKGVAAFIRNQKPITGDFDVIMEARITETYAEVPFLALLAAWQGEYDHTRFGTLAGALSWYEHHDKDHRERIFRVEASRAKPPYDPTAWTRYELRYRQGWIHALINGREVHKMKRPAHRSGGYVGILSQECRGEIRRLDVLHR